MSEALLFDLFQRLGLALGIGFLVGVERGWKHRDAPEQSRAAGLRTHAVIGLFGGISGALASTLGELAFAALTLGFAAAFLAFKLRESAEDGDISVTGTIAGLLVFALGAYAVLGEPRVAAAAGVALAALLAFKEGLHGWLEKLTWQEIRSALLILAMTAIALPLLPDRAIDPWEAINPRELWLLAILVAGASFAGYIAVRWLGPKTGLLAGAAAGSLVSSTVVTADLGRRVRAAEAEPVVAAAAACLAASVSLGRVIVLTALFAGPALFEAAPALAAAILVFVAGAFLLSRRSEGASDGADQAGQLSNPLNILSVLQFAAILAVMIVAGQLIADRFGEAGLLPFAATAGLADVDAVTLATSSLVGDGLDPAAGGHAILVGALANTLAKGGLAAATGGPRYAAWFAAVFVAAILAGAAVWALV